MNRVQIVVCLVVEGEVKEVVVDLQKLCYYREDSD